MIPLSHVRRIKCNEFFSISMMITLTPEIMASYDDAREKGYTGSLTDFIHEVVEAYLAIKQKKS